MLRICFLHDRSLPSHNGIGEAARHSDLARMYYSFYVSLADPLMLVQPTFLRYQAWVACYIWGPFYLLLAWALFRGHPWIRLPALLYAGSAAYGVSLWIFVNIFDQVERAAPAVWFACTLPYLVFPICLLVRYLPSGRSDDHASRDNNTESF